MTTPTRRTTVHAAGLLAASLATGTLAAGTLGSAPADAAERPIVSSLSVFTANIAQAGRVPALRSTIAEKKPDVVVLSEAWNARAFLRDFGGYQVIQAGTGHQNAGGVALLVRRGSGLEIVKKEFLRMKLGFTGPHGRTQPARVYPAVALRSANQTWRVLGIHFPWVKQAKRLDSATWKESSNATVSYLKRGDTGANIAAGDFNSTPAQMRTMGKRVPAHFVRGGAVDHALAKRTDTRASNNLGAPQGMHGWVLYRFTAA